MKKFILIFLLLIVTLSLASEIRVRPDSWAKKVIGSPLKNFHKLDDKVYRSEQPDTSEMSMLYKFGIREILNLRSLHTDDDEASATKLKLHLIKMKAENITDKEIVVALKIIKNAKGPILVHCWHGSDRTGTVIAMYRIIFQNWSKKDALDELLNGGYGYHSIYKNIPEYIKKADITKIKKAVFGK